MSELKRHGINISISTIATLIPVLAFLWLFIQPALVDAVADDLDEMIEAKQAPVQSAFKALLNSEINKVKKEIAGLKFIRDHHADEWTEDDADYLADLEIELLALQEAKAEL